MQPRIAAILITLIMAMLPLAVAGGKADNKASITVHLETENSENPKMIFQQEIGGRTRYFRRMPDFSTKDIVSFSPFPSEGGGDFGVVFKLKEHVARRLAAITSSNQGRWLVISANGRPVDGVLVDKQIDDGIIVAWKGINLSDIEVFDKSLPRIGQEGVKRKKD